MDAKDFWPIKLRHVGCPKCRTGKLTLSRDETKFWYDPCPNCGFVKKMRPLKTRDRSMQCPHCRTPLVKGEDRGYETLPEHVACNDNYDPGDRPTFVCPKKRCPLHGNVFFDPGGALYTLDINMYGSPLYKRKNYRHATRSVWEQVHRKTDKKCDE